ncbi:hypothetical protein AMATHDRAFT_139845 [Amanita thiersii Skay4041]|uniref:A to I editase domain-containing protein n=1 Tax=Amanita thiersii Skay4041 TaxID=703135 RepID=A0A2A9NXM7_9AGAR|nr:hypothetical protein AMATHDRAFT_139845 [Amanita thiersii Skay4041]
MADTDDAVHTILNLYSSLSYTPPYSHYTILAAFYLSSTQNKIISLATGTKCLPTTRFPARGEALHDSHAEIVARRAALRWFLEEILRYHTLNNSEWIYWDVTRGKYSLLAGVELNLYISSIPCGDASMRYLTATQNEEMARLKDLVPNGTIPGDLLSNNSGISRGRDVYARLGVLRTKPGRADSPPTICMSCSDKIALWNVVGIQGALGSRLFTPLYLTSIVIGEVAELDGTMKSTITEDCERAFWGRLAGEIRDLPDGYSVHKPAIHFTTLPFMHSRTQREKLSPGSSSSNESLCWVAERTSFEVLINGFKHGVSPKHRLRDKSRPLVCKLSLFQCLNSLHSILQSITNMKVSQTYHDLKKAEKQYQRVKSVLKDDKAPFSGWIRSGESWESFFVNGEVLNEVVIQASS